MDNSIVGHWPWWSAVFVFIGCILALVIVACRTITDTQTIFWYQVLPKLISMLAVLLLATTVSLIIDKAFPTVVIGKAPNTNVEIPISVLWYLTIRSAALLLVFTISLYFLQKAASDE